MKKWLLLLGILAFAGCSCTPSDKPTPTPSPDGGTSIVILFDSEAADDYALYADPSLDEYADTHGHALRIHAMDTVDETGKCPSYLEPYVNTVRLDGHKLPCAMVGKGGKVLGSLDQPADVQKIIALVEKHVGEEEDVSNSIWAGGAWRKLGGVSTIPPGAEKRWPVEGQNEPLIPEAKWQEIDLSGFAWEIKDQDGISSCCPTSGTTVYEVYASRAGLKKFQLSALDAYCRINGGRDAGATLEDFLNVATKEGICTTDFAPIQGVKKPKYKKGYDSSRAKHRILKANFCPTWEAMASALQRRKPVQFGLMVSGDFSPNKDGVIGPKRKRGGGGHAVVALGMKKVGGASGEWYLVMQNSWSDKWGGSADGKVKKGCCLLHPSWAEPAFGCWALCSCVSPSDDPIAGVRPKGGQSEPVYAVAP